MLVRPSAAATASPLDRAAGEATVTPLRAAAARAADPLSLAGLPACVEDVTAAARRPAESPPDPRQLAALRARLQRAAAALPARYRTAVAAPLLRALDGLGPSGWARLLAEDPEREGQARLLLDLAQAVLQRGEGHRARATAAFQEVVWDLYDGFLGAEARRGVKPPELGVLPPLVRWGEADGGPYTWPVTATVAFEVRAPVVSLPAGNAAGGLLAWAALAHETVGHDLLEADRGLRDELARAVREEARAAGVAGPLADYWAERIEESASDVLGVLNMGPAAALGLVGYFRGLLGALTGQPALRGDGDAEDPHPADLARAYLAAETVRLLPLAGAARWADRLTAEADQDAGRVLHLGGVAVTAGVAKHSAAAVARAIARTRLAALEGRSLADVQAWSDRDEAVVAALRRELSGGGAARGTLPGRLLEGAYAAHVVAAAVQQAASGATPPGQVQERMLDLLAEMHGRNPAWAAARAA
jgi:hypothetical protein